jgi:hypothetical protein
MTRSEALAFVDSEITTRTKYGIALAGKKPPPPEWVIETERNRLRQFMALRDWIRAEYHGEMNSGTDQATGHKNRA